MVTTAPGTTLVILTIYSGQDHLDGWVFTLTGYGQHDHLFTIVNNELRAGNNYVPPGKKYIQISAAHPIFGTFVDPYVFDITDVVATNKIRALDIPKDVGVRSWYDGADRSTIVDITTPGQVEQWTDKGVSLNHLTRNVENWKPSYENDTVTFGLDDSMEFTTPLLTPYYMFVVGSPRVNTSTRSLLYTSSGNQPFVVNVGSDNVGHIAGGFGAPLTPIAWAQDELAIMGFVSSAQSYQKNGGSLSFVLFGSPDDQATAFGGNAGTNLEGFGDVKEVILIDIPFDPDVVLKIEGYLAHKWGLTANLAVDHPYKTEPPLSDRMKNLYADGGLIAPIVGSTTYEILVSYKYDAPVDPLNPSTTPDIDVLTINDVVTIKQRTDWTMELTVLSQGNNTYVMPPPPDPNGYGGHDGWFNFRMVREDRGTGLKTYYELNGYDLVAFTTDPLVDIIKLSTPKISSGEPIVPLRVTNISVIVDGVSYVHEEFRDDIGVFVEDV